METPASAVARYKSLFCHPVFVAAVLLAVAGFVRIWLDSGGRLGVWPKHTIYYPVLADAFLNGQISLRVTPRPELLALPDPYDPAANQAYRWHDVSLFEGKYYLPWGPVPAMMVAAAGKIGIDTPYFDDEGLCVLFVLGTVMMATVLVSQARAKLFPGLSPWTVLPPVLALGLGAAALKCNAVGGAAIAGGQFFLLSGLCAAWFGFASNRRGWVWMMMAGVCWALGAGSRISLPPAVGIVAGMTAWQIWRGKDENAPATRTRIRASLALAIPLLAGAGVLAWYNFARFGSILETGVQYQLTGRNQHSGPESHLFSAAYIIPSLIRYLFEPPQWQKAFPFLVVGNSPFKTGFDGLLGLSHSYGFDWIIGLVWAQPFLIFSMVILGVGVLRKRLFEACSERDQNRGRWLVVALTAGGVAGFLPTLAYGFSSMRYMMDAVPCFSVLAALGYFWVLENAVRRGRGMRRAIEGLVVAMVFMQSLLGILVAFSGTAESFALVNPEFYSAIVSWFGLR